MSGNTPGRASTPPATLSSAAAAGRPPLSSGGLKSGGVASRNGLPNGAADALSGSGSIDGAGSGGDTVVVPKASKKPGSSENGKVANAAPPSAGEVLDGLRGAASAVLSEHAAAAERVRTLGLDIAAREAAQLDATNADDFEAAEALERPLQRSRVELSESTVRYTRRLELVSSAAHP